MKLNSKRSETESAAYVTKMIRVSARNKPFMKLNSKRSQTEFGTPHAAYAIEMIRVGSELEPFIKLNRSDFVVTS